jgi:hypothetical protein
MNLLTSLFSIDTVSIAMLWRFLLSTFVVWILVHFFYYPRSRRRDYYFTFMLISISIFFLIFLMGGVHLKIGFALGLFAIFGIIRYRTESMPVREMTYLFVIISLSVVNALSSSVSVLMLILTNCIFVLSAWFFESGFLHKNISVKLIQYDRIELIKPDRYEELKADLEERTGLKIVKVDVGGLDFLRDMAMVKIYYESTEREVNTIDGQIKIEREEWTNV